jgi:hypothetical protein
MLPGLEPAINEAAPKTYPASSSLSDPQEDLASANKALGAAAEASRTAALAKREAEAAMAQLKEELAQERKTAQAKSEERVELIKKSNNFIKLSRVRNGVALVGKSHVVRAPPAGTSLPAGSKLWSRVADAATDLRCLTHPVGS